MENIRSTKEAVEQAQAELQKIHSTLSTSIREFEARQENLNSAATITLSRIQDEVKDSSLQLSTSTKAAETVSANLTMMLAEQTPALQKISRTISTKLWAGSLMLAITLFVLTTSLLTWLRPGWTLTPEQHQALYVGSATIRDYSQLSPADQAKVRKLLHWRDPITEP